MQNTTMKVLNGISTVLIIMGLILFLIPNFIDGRPWQPGTKNSLIILFIGLFLRAFESLGRKKRNE